MLSPQEVRELQHRIGEQHDELAFGQLYTAYLPYLISFAKSIIRNKELAEEIVSDVFVRIWQRREKVPQIENFRLYLYISTRNTALNYLARHYRRNVLPLDEMAAELQPSSYDPEQHLLSREINRKVQAEIEQLPPRCRLIFKLVKEDRLKYSEIAELLHISIKTIDNQMAIAIRRIAAAVRVDLQTPATTNKK
jgi:RNA polymerase sigma-70 factor (ECF subfamily)